MKRHIINLILFSACLFFTVSCHRGPLESKYKHIGGYVIGKETCHADESQDYWLVDFTYWADTPQVGDALVLNGRTFTNVLKIKGLIERFKQIGLPISFDYQVISSNKVNTTGCDVANPVTYPLKELFIINQGEIR
jgi:hypothetical protein